MKRLALFFTIVAIASSLSLTACGGEKKPSGETSPSPEETSPAPEQQSP
ncbi:MAG: hypothetical protein AB4426_00280 [Xenococcaceae cyanobacterium]